MRYIIAFLCLCSTIWASPVYVNTVAPVCVGGSCQIRPLIGNGIVISHLTDTKTGIAYSDVLTTAHGTWNCRSVKVNGVEASVLAYNTDFDAAIVRVTGSLPVSRISMTDPLPNEPIFLRGYDPNSLQPVAWTYQNIYVSPAQGRRIMRFVRRNISSQGFSGSAFYNARGEVAGMLQYEVPMQQTFFMTATSIRAFLLSVNYQLPQAQSPTDDIPVPNKIQGEDWNETQIKSLDKPKSAIPEEQVPQEQVPQEQVPQEQPTEEQVPQEQPPVSEPGLSDRWKSFGLWAGKLAISVFAPELAVPVGVAGSIWGWIAYLRKRKRRLGGPSAFFPGGSDDRGFY